MTSTTNKTSSSDWLIGASDSPSLDDGDSDVPFHLRDQVAFSRFIFIFLGIGLLQPWNTFISAVGYFILEFNDPAIEFVLSFTYCVPIVVVMLLMIFYGHKLSYKTHIIYSFSIQILAVFAIIWVIEYMGAKKAYPIFLACLFCVGACQAVLFAAAFAYASVFPSSYTQALMAGNGYAGVIAISLRIITKAIFPNTPEGLIKSSVIYFILCIVILIICILLFIKLDTMAISKFFFAQENKTRPDSETNNLIDNPSQLSYNEDSISSENQESESLLSYHPEATWWDACKQVDRHAFTVFFVFFITLSLFPGVATSIPSRSGLGTWYPVIILASFMVGDLIGRSAPHWILLFNKKQLIYVALVRVIFIPLLFMCVKPKIFESDVFGILIILCLALSNGYTSSCAMMYGVEVAHDHAKEKAGTLMPFFLNIGVTAGLALSLGYSKYLLNET